ALVASINVFLAESQRAKAWMAGTSDGVEQWFDMTGIRSKFFNDRAEVAALPAHRYVYAPFCIVASREGGRDPIPGSAGDGVSGSRQQRDLGFIWLDWS